MKKEKDIQKRIVSYIFKRYGKEVNLVVNPMSDMPLPKGWTAIQLGKFWKNMRAQGWQQSQPDLLILHPAFDFCGLAIELKKDEKSNPVREFRGKPGKLWINETTNTGKEYERSIGQARYLSNLIGQGYFACFCADEKKAILLIDAFLNKGSQMPPYELIEVSNLCRYTGRNGQIFKLAK